MRHTKLHGLMKVAAALGILVIVAACQDLDVENLNNPDRERALSEAGDVMVLVQSSWEGWYWRHHRSCWPGYAMWSHSGEQTTSVGNCGGWPWGAGEPRTRYNNTTTGAETGVTQTPWYGLYTDISSANEGLVSIQNGMEFGSDGEDTRMVEAFARFTWGLSMGWMSKFFDQAFIVRADDDLEDPDTYQVHPWQDVRTAAIESLMAAADIAQAHQFTVPDTWINGEAITSQRLIQLAHTYAALLHVYGARDPDERASEVDWNQVLFHLDRAITEPFAPMAESGGAPYSLYRFRIAATGTFSWRTSNYLLGPGDISGRFQDWLRTPLADRDRFVIESADRRIHPEGDPMQEGDVDRDQTYFWFRVAGRPGGSIEGRGLYLHSYYLFRRGADDWVSTGNYYNTRINVFHPDELDLIRAEAYHYTNQTQAAVDIINSFRARGELPPITAAGVPQSADCVPRKLDGSCGDFMDALAWERGIELVGLRGIRAYFDRRGFGQMVCGSMQQIPIPARELESQLMPVYSFGGVGGEGAMNPPHCIPSEGAI